jgi:hypothetical protein
MTTATTWLPTVRPFTPEECAILASAGIITEDEQAAVLAGKRRFTVDECMEMLEAGVLHEDDRIELIDGEFSWSSRLPTLPSVTTAAPSWHATPRPASSKCGLSTCKTER